MAGVLAKSLAKFIPAIIAELFLIAVSIIMACFLVSAKKDIFFKAILLRSVLFLYLLKRYNLLAKLIIICCIDQLGVFSANSKSCSSEIQAAVMLELIRLVMAALQTCLKFWAWNFSFLPQPITNIRLQSKLGTLCNISDCPRLPLISPDFNSLLI